MSFSDRESRYDFSSTGPEDVLTFWFGKPGTPPLSHSTKWWTKDAAFDEEVKDSFLETHELGARGALDGWKSAPRGRLALVIVLDQFSRNIFRGTARSFAQDARACDSTLEAIAAGDEQSLELIERSFLYMPLMHAEDVDLQHKCVAAFDRLLKKSPEPLQKYIANCLDFAKKHAEIIERFGRFPHRNDILGRASSAEELEFLKQPGSSF